MADYSITAVDRRVVYSGSAGTGPYAFTFPVLATTDIAVYKDSTKLTEGTGSTQYQVTLNASNGTGSVTLNTAATSDNTITITGARTIERTTDFVTAGDLLASSLNTELDSQTIFVQQVSEDASRAIQAPVTDPTSIDMTLPLKADRLGKFLSFNSSTGNPEVTVSTSDVTGAAASATAAASSATAAASSASSASSSASTATTKASEASASATAAAASAASAAVTIASQAEAEAGTNNANIMTPLRTKQAVDGYGLLSANNLSDVGSAATARTNLGLGTAATLTAGTSANNAVQLDGSGALPAVSGENLTSLNVTDVSSDVRFLALQVASDRIGLEDGIADPFADETDINNSSSTNESHNSSSTFYAPTLSVGSAQDLSSKSYFGNMTGGGGVAAAFDGTTSQTYQNSASGTTTTGTIGVALGSGNGFVLTQAKIYAPNNTGMNAGNGIKIYGNSSASASGGTLLHTGAIGSGTAATATFAINNTVSYENYYAEILFSSGTAYVAELELFDGTPQNMTLVSNAFTADSAPASAIIGVQTVENESVTINTDLTAEVSRDGGTNFTSCTLVLNTELGATSTKYYESASTDISSQPSGTSMVFRIKTLNTKDIEVHGVTFKWSS